MVLLMFFIVTPSGFVVLLGFWEKSKFFSSFESANFQFCERTSKILGTINPE
jgi:hypothetical protein